MLRPSRAICGPRPGGGWENGAYLFHDGYWATSVGFYGGIWYGFGYFGHGFEGGRWEGDHFFYNRAVVNINTVTIHNVYNETVVNRVTVVNHVSFNGGEGGIQERPRPEELAVERERHLPPVSAQTQHIQTARSNPQLRASANQGRPPVAATERATEFRGAVAAKAAGAPYHAPVRRPNSGSTVAKPVGNPNPTHARDLQPHQAPETQGNAGGQFEISATTATKADPKNKTRNTRSCSNSKRRKTSAFRSRPIKPGSNRRSSVTPSRPSRWSSATPSSNSIFNPGSLRRGLSRSVRVRTAE